MNIVKRFVIQLIKIYQKTLSFDHGFLGKLYPNTTFCKFKPTCSEYACIVIEEHGVIKGGWMAFKRFLKCNPWSRV